MMQKCIGDERKRNGNHRAESARLELAVYLRWRNERNCGETTPRRCRTWYFVSHRLLGKAITKRVTMHHLRRFKFSCASHDAAREDIIEYASRIIAKFLCIRHRGWETPLPGFIVRKITFNIRMKRMKSNVRTISVTEIKISWNFCEFWRYERAREIKFENIEFSGLSELRSPEDVCGNLDSRVQKYVWAAV